MMGPFKKLIIYYFSGTGNSKNVALWIADEASKKQIITQIINITCLDRLSTEAPSGDTLIIFISPIHGFNYPPVMLHFITRFPKGKNSVLLMNTRAGMLIGKFVTPGLTGIAFYFSALLLRLKGYSIVGMYPVDMPSNWISIHPGLNERTIKYLHQRNEERVRACASRIFSGKTFFKKVLTELIQDIIVSPVAILYYFIGRFVLAKTYYASRDCDDCDICIKNCPVKAIIKVDNRPFWTFKCESCMRCMGNCPRKAIETGHGSFAEFMIIFSLIIMNYFYKLMPVIFFDNILLRNIFESALYLLVIAGWYRLVHYLMRYRIIERIMVYTSLTKYKFWGRRYKALKIHNAGKDNSILPSKS
jgi:Pyruvate/2-oxoacid:ferredoxin oxidoreductase delta subunit